MAMIVTGTEDRFGVPEQMHLALREAVFHPEREHRFDPVRGWRFDVALSVLKIGFGCEDGVGTSGYHTWGKGYGQICEKYNAVAITVWLVLRCSVTIIREQGTSGVITDVQRLAARGRQTAGDPPLLSEQG